MDDNIVDYDIDSLEATKLLLLEELERVDERIDETKADWKAEELFMRNDDEC